MATSDKTRKAMRRINREIEVAGLREGRRTRSVVFTDRRKESSRKACRKAARDSW